MEHNHQPYQPSGPGPTMTLKIWNDDKKIWNYMFISVDSKGVMAPQNVVFLKRWLVKNGIPSDKLNGSVDLEQVAKGCGIKLRCELK